MIFIINPYWYKKCSDSDSQLFITAAGITNSTQQDAICQLVTDLKTFNIWNSMIAIYPFVGGSANSHKYNLKNPVDSNAAKRISFIGAFTHDSNGVTPGLNAYMDTHVLGNTDITNSNAGMGVYSRTNVLNQGAFGIGGNFHIHARWTNNFTYFRICTDPVLGSAVNVGSSLGLIHAYSTPTTISNQFYRGNYLGTVGGTFNPGAANVKFGWAGPGYQYDPRQLAFAFVSGALTNTQATNLYTAVQAYQTTLGRQV